MEVAAANSYSWRENVPIAEHTELLNPVGEVDVLDASLAPRLADLNGKVVCFIDNGQLHVDAFLARIEQRLCERYRLAEIVRKRKSKAAGPCPDLQELDKWDFAIAGIGL